MGPKKIGLPFVQPGGPGGVRIYSLSKIKEVLAESAVKVQNIMGHHQKNSTQKSISISPCSKKSKGKIGTGLAARTPAKRGPKSDLSGGTS